MKKNIIKVVKENKGIIVKSIIAFGGVVGVFALGKALTKNEAEDVEDVEEDNVVDVNFGESEE